MPESVLRRCTLLIEQNYPLGSSAALFSATERAALPGDCTTLRVPLVGFNSLWPLVCVATCARAEPSDYPWGRYPLPFNDRLALKILESRLDPEKRVAAYHATDVNSVVDLGRFHEIQAQQMIENERTCDVRIAPYVLTHFREKRLFLEHHHPSPALTRLHMLAQLFTHQRFAPFRPDMVGAMLTGRFLSGSPSAGRSSARKRRSTRRSRGFFELAWWSPSSRVPPSRPTIHVRTDGSPTIEPAAALTDRMSAAPTIHGAALVIADTQPSAPFVTVVRKGCETMITYADPGASKPGLRQ